MSEIIRKDSIQNDLIQNVDQSIEDDEQLSTFERSSLHDDIIDQQIDSKTSDILQTDLDEDRHQEVSNPHTDMNRPFDRQGMNNHHTDMNTSQPFDNLHTDMKGPQSFDRQSSHSFRASKSFQSAISTTELFSLSREKRSLFEPIRPLINPIEPRRHSTGDVSRVEIHPPSSRNLMDQIDEIPTGQTSLKITDIFGRLNIADKIEKAKEIAKEKDKAKDQKDQFKSSKPSSSRSIESSDVDSANIIEDKRNRKPNPKYAQLVYEEWMKIPQFHAAFMAGVWTKEENEVKSSKLSEDAKY
jgi:hypothetical protein